MAGWTIVVRTDAETAETPSVPEFKTALEKGSDEQKLAAMKQIIEIMLNGDPMPQLLMHMIRFVMPSKSKPLKKLLYLYWEICPKHNPDGRLKQEMILVCNGIRNDLQHPNEYMRGTTLRFLCKLKEPELIEPLLPTLRACLDHRHSYVRKYAIMAIWSVFRVSEHLFPDVADTLAAHLSGESDSVCRRNAFVALCDVSPVHACDYLENELKNINNLDEGMLIAVVDFVRRDALTNEAQKANYLRLMFRLLDAKSHAVAYEAAMSLTALTDNVAAIKAAASKFIQLAVGESDNNVKFIVLDRVEQLRKSYPGVLDELVMDVLRTLSSPDVDVRIKALDIAMEMLSSKSVDEVVQLLKKELSKSLERDYEKNNEYQQSLIHAIHSCAIRYPEVAESVVYLLIDFIGVFNRDSAADVVIFIKEVIEKFPKLRKPILERFSSSLPKIVHGRVMRGALWVIGEYCSDEDGAIPIISSELKHGQSAEQDKNDVMIAPTFPPRSHRVLEDGTYATENAFTLDPSAKAKAETEKPSLRKLILNGDYFTATVLSATLTKLVLRYSKICEDLSRLNALRAEAMLFMTSIIRYGQWDQAEQKIDEDSVDRIMGCFNSLSDCIADKEEIVDAFLHDTRKAYVCMLQLENKRSEARNETCKAEATNQPDALLSIRQFSQYKMKSNKVDKFTVDLQMAIRGIENEVKVYKSDLNRIVQLTGASDPVYAEAIVKVNKFDIVLDVLLVNQTGETLPNLSVEFATLGDLKIVERPACQSVGPHAFLSVQATVKVSSADTGVIFGNIIYDSSSTAEANVVILNDIHVNIMDYIFPAHCSENKFRAMWSEFEWENSVKEKSCEHDLRAYLDQLLAKTNMACLTAEPLVGDCAFLSANLYAKSIFGEDALANVSVERTDDGTITGYVRIRSKGQGMALSLGQVLSK